MKDNLNKIIYFPLIFIGKSFFLVIGILLIKIEDGIYISQFNYINSLLGFILCFVLVPIQTQILSYKNSDEDERNKYNIKIFFNSFCFLIFLIIILVGLKSIGILNTPNIDYFQDINITILYCLGMFFGTFKISLYNQLQSFRSSAIYTLLFFSLPVIFTIMLYYLNLFNISYFYYTVGLFGILIFFCNNNLDFKKTASVLNLRSIVFSSLSNGYYGVLLMLLMFLVNFIAVENLDQNDISKFSTIFLLFTYFYYLPSVSGSVIVPILCNNGNKVLKNIILLHATYYLITSFVVFILLPKIILINDLSKFFLLLLILIIVAGFNSLFIQFNISQKNINKSNFSSLLNIVTFITLCLTNDLTIKNLLIFMVFSFFFSLIFNLISYLKIPKFSF